MEALILSSFRAVRSLLAPGMFRLFVLSIAVTIAALMGFVAFSSYFFAWLAHHLQGHSIAAFLPWLGSIGSAVIAWFLFPGIMPVIISFFDDRNARLIEQHDYPTTLQPHKPAFWPELLHDMRFSALAITLNILVLPLYLLPALNLILFYLLNGYLLGREFFVMVARRHMPIHEAESLRNRYGRTVMVAGMMLAVLATIPGANLFAPFWGIAVMVHLYHKLTPTSASELLPST